MDSERDRVLVLLRQALPGLQRDFAVESLSLFGSMARGEATAESDIDLLVTFSGPVGLFRLADLRQRLSEVLDRRVDLGTEGSLPPRVRDHVVREAIRVE